MSWLIIPHPQQAAWRHCALFSTHTTSFLSITAVHDHGNDLAVGALAPLCPLTPPVPVRHSLPWGGHHSLQFRKLSRPLDHLSSSRKVHNCYSAEFGVKPNHHSRAACSSDNTQSLPLTGLRASLICRTKERHFAQHSQSFHCWSHQSPPGCLSLGPQQMSSTCAKLRNR